MYNTFNENKLLHMPVKEKYSKSSILTSWISKLLSWDKIHKVYAFLLLVLNKCCIILTCLLFFKPYFGMQVLSYEHILMDGDIFMNSRDLRKMYALG